MSLLSKFTVTPLLYACGFLLLTCAALGGTLAWKTHGFKADIKQAHADVQTTTTSRDAYKARVDELAAANDAYDVALTTLRRELTKCQSENTRVTKAGDAAVAAAQVQATEADRTLDKFLDQFKTATHDGKCGVALAAMQAACSTLDGY